MATSLSHTFQAVWKRVEPTAQRASSEHARALDVFLPLQRQQARHPRRAFWDYVRSFAETCE